MADSTALVRAVLPRPDGIKNPFFAEAYRAARGDNAQLIQQDGERLVGCLVHVASQRGLNPSVEEDRRAALQVLNAYLTLGLSEAAEDNPAQAVGLLRARPIDLFVQLGQGLHDEIRQKAAEARQRSVLKCESGLYGIWNPAMEAEIAAIADPSTHFSERGPFHEAKKRIQAAEREIDLAAYFPLQHGLDRGAYHLNFQRQAYRRKNKETPSPLGSVFHLFLRSFLLKSLSEKEAWEDTKAWLGKGIPEFIDFNFISSALLLKGLIQDVFFNPEQAARAIPMALGGLAIYLKTELYAFSPQAGGSYRKPALARSSPLHKTALQLAESLLTEFGEEVRAYYKVAQGADVTADDLNRFWYPHILAQAKWGGFDEQGRSLWVDPGRMAAAGTTMGLQALLRVPPEGLAEYLNQASQWPDELRRAFIAQYKWGGLFPQMGDPSLFETLVVIVRELGPEMLHKFDAKRLTLEFWFRAWEDKAELRDAIFNFFREERYTRKMNARILLNAIQASAFGRGDDTRLLDLLLTRVVRDEKGAYIERGIAVHTWTRVLVTLSNKPESLKSVWRYIPPQFRGPVLDTFVPDEKARLLHLVGASRG